MASGSVCQELFYSFFRSFCPRRRLSCKRLCYITKSPLPCQHLFLSFFRLFSRVFWPSFLLRSARQRGGFCAGRPHPQVLAAKAAAWQPSFQPNSAERPFRAGSCRVHFPDRREICGKLCEMPLLERILQSSSSRNALIAP